jgi:hypothetical protein
VIVSCRRFIEAITAEWEGALPGWERKYFHEHGENCAACRRYLEGFGRTVELLGELPAEPAPEPLRADLIDRFRQARRR